MLRYHLLGRLRVRRDDVEIQLGARKERALLAMLLSNANRVVSTDQLVDALWADGGAKNPQNVLWVNISKLRSVLDPDRPKGSDSTVLVTRPPGYMLVTETDAIDAGRFESLTDEGRRLLDIDPSAASLVFHEALALWHGRALEEFVYDEFAQAEVARLEELRLAAVEDRVDADLRTGASRELVGELESLTRLHPLRERLAAHLMVALHRSGRQGEALRAYGTFRRTLRDELGLDPSADLSALEERIVLDDPSLRISDDVLVPVGAGPATSAVRGHELRQRIGVGPRGVVHVAYEPAVGRELAIKVIRPELADDPDFIRRFETESQALERLVHPRIVATFDRWRQPGAAYVTMPLFVRGSLQAALDRGELSLEDGLRVIDHVAEALGAAHRLGVVHGNLKPTNILLDTDGNASVADFALAASAGGMTPTPFSAPEHQRGAELTPSSDTYSLAMLTTSVLRGVENEGSRPTDVAAAVIARGTSDDPTARHDGPEAFAHDLHAAFGVGAHSPLVAATENPYVGLQAFQEQDAGRFFGRERLVERLVARLGRSGVQGRLIVVVGPSGAGKSSVVRAGVLPAVRHDALGDADRWFQATMTPGSDPFAALALALRCIAVDEMPGLAEKLRLEGIAATTASMLPEPDARLVLVVDQLEELFTHASPDDADAFLDALAASADDPHSPIRIIATLRADHYDRPLRHQTFGEVLRHSTELITPMTAAELEQATVAPAAAAGVTFEGGLVPEIVSDVMGRTSALPLLQHAMTELFERRVGATIGAASYAAIGGVTGALVRTAEDVYDGFEREARTQVRDMFLRLVTLGDGVPDTRRRVLVSELTGAGASHVPEILETFGRHRLLSFDHDPVTRGATVEIAHESLLTEWRRLAEWIDHTRADVQAQRSLSGLASTWREHDEDPAFLLPEGQADSYATWIERPPVRLTATETDFLASSVAAVEGRRAADVHRLRRLRRLVTMTGVALVIALVAGGLAVRQRNNAQSSANEARRAQSEAIEAAAAAEASEAVAESSTLEAEASAAEAEAATLVAEASAEEARASAEAADLATLVSRSAALRTDNPTVAVLLALEAHRRSETPETLQALTATLTSRKIGRLVASRPMIEGDCGVGFTAAWLGGNARHVVVDGRLVSRDVVTGERTDMGPAPAPCANGGTDGSIGYATLPNLSKAWVGPALGTEISFDVPSFPRGVTPTRLVVQDILDQTTFRAKMYDTASGVAVGELVQQGYFSAGAVNDELALIALSIGASEAGASSVVTVRDAETFGPLFELSFEAVATAVAFDPATNEMLVGLTDGRIQTIDLATQEVIASVDGLPGPREFGIAADGTVTVVSLGGIALLDRRAGLLPGVRPIELSTVQFAVVQPNGMITVESPGTVAVYSFAGGGLAEQAWDVGASTAAVVDGRAAVLDPVRQAVEVIDFATGERQAYALLDSDGTPFVAGEVYPEPDGVWAVSADYALGRWEGEELVERLDLGPSPDVRGVGREGTLIGTRHDRWYASLGRADDGREFATLVELDRDDPRIVFRIETSDVSDLIPSRDGGMHVFRTDGLLVTYDSAGAEIGRLDTGLESPVFPTIDAVSGKLAVVGQHTTRGIVEVIDPATATVQEVPGRNFAVSLGFAGPLGLLAITTTDGTVRLWDIDAWEPASVLFAGSEAVVVSDATMYDPETEMLSALSSRQVLQFSLDPDRWIEQACEFAGRDLTAEEWNEYVPGDIPPTSACES